MERKVNKIKEEGRYICIIGEFRTLQVKLILNKRGKNTYFQKLISREERKDVSNGMIQMDKRKKVNELTLGEEKEIKK